MKAIIVSDYDPAWPAQFDALKAEIGARLAGLGTEFFHVGSTAVPGLGAKPKIDLHALLPDETSLSRAIERMRADPSYAFQGTPYDDAMWTFTSGRGSHGARLYLCLRGNPVHEARVLFRDHLRGHAEAAADYAALKRRLAVEAAGDWTVYTGGKSEFVRRIVAEARVERQKRSDLRAF